MALNNDNVMQWKLIDLINNWAVSNILNISQYKDGSILVHCAWGNIDTPGTLYLV